MLGQRNRKGRGVIIQICPALFGGIGDVPDISPAMLVAEMSEPFWLILEDLGHTDRQAIDG